MRRDQLLREEAKFSKLGAPGLLCEKPIQIDLRAGRASLTNHGRSNALGPPPATESFGQALMHTQQSMADENPGAVDVILGGTLLGDPSLR